MMKITVVRSDRIYRKMMNAAPAEILKQAEDFWG